MLLQRFRSFNYGSKSHPTIRFKDIPKFMDLWNPDILFDITKRLIQDCGQNAVFRYRLFGNAAWKTLKKVFAFVTILKLFDNRCIIGWSNGKCITLNYIGGKPYPLAAIYCIGQNVKHLEIHTSKFSIFKLILETIIEKRQLTYFSISPKWNDKCISKIIFQCSATLKHLEIRYQYFNLFQSANSKFFITNLTLTNIGNEMNESFLKIPSILTVFPLLQNLKFEVILRNLDVIKLSFIENQLFQAKSKYQSSGKPFNVPLKLTYFLNGGYFFSKMYIRNISIIHSFEVESDLYFLVFRKTLKLVDSHDTVLQIEFVR